MNENKARWLKWIIKSLIIIIIIIIVIVIIIIIIKNVIKQRIDYQKKLNEEFCFYGNLHLLP